MFKIGDKVRLSSLGMDRLSVGTDEVSPNPCTKRLLSGESLAISNIVLQAGGKTGYSLHFYGGGYSYTEKYFELA
jgi:hypothetical protein